MANAPYVTNILDSLKECRDISVNEELEAGPTTTGLRDWNPFDMGEGRALAALEPEGNAGQRGACTESCGHPDLAVVVLGRTAGEDMEQTVQSREAIC